MVDLMVDSLASIESKKLIILCVKDGGPALRPHQWSTGIYCFGPPLLVYLCNTYFLQVQGFSIMFDVAFTISGSVNNSKPCYLFNTHERCPCCFSIAGHGHHGHIHQ